jgi:quercetin dioxygenase-like cupin family protein
MEPQEPAPQPAAEAVTVPPGTPLRRLVARGADVVLVVTAGRPLIGLGAGPPRPRPPGSSVVCPRGVPWSVAGGDEGGRLVVVAVPAGPQRALAALVGPPPLDGAALVAAAADGGLEVVLEPLPGTWTRPGARSATIVG